MTFKPGSTLWLIAFDLKLVLRGLAGRMRVSYVRMLITFGVLWLLVIHGGAWIAVVAIGHMRHPLGAVQENLILSVVVGLIFLVSLGTGLVCSVNLIFMHGDLDMLCASPMPTRNVFTARSLSIALQAAALPAFLLLPVANVQLLYGRVQWLALYPVSLAIGLMAAGLAIPVTLLLVGAIGARGARTLTLTLGALFGAALFVAFELPSVLGKTVTAQLLQSLKHWLQTAPMAQSSSPLWYPARATQGDIWPLLVVVAVAALAFLAVTLNLQRGFLFAMQRAAGVSVPGRLRKSRGGFNPGFWRVVFLKEWRMVYRNPQLLVQILSRLIYLVPAAYILFRDKELLKGSYLPFIAAALVFVAAQLAYVLVWVSVCAEDAPEFLASTPRLSGALRTTKMQVMLAPLWIVMLIVAIVVGTTSVVTGFWLAVATLGASLSVGVYHLWMPVPGARTELRRAMRTGGLRWDHAFPLLVIQFGWAGVAFCMPTGHWLWGVIALLLALIAPVFVWWRSLHSGSLLAY